MSSGRWGSMTANNGLGTGGRTQQLQELADAVNDVHSATLGASCTTKQVKDKLKSLRRTCQRAIS